MKIFFITIHTSTILIENKTLAQKKIKKSFTNTKIINNFAADTIFISINKV